MSTPELKVNNGKRVAVKLPDFGGSAGYVEMPNGEIHLAYRPNRSGVVEEGLVILVDEEKFTVLSSEPSNAVEGFRVLKLARVVETS